MQSGLSFDEAVEKDARIHTESVARIDALFDGIQQQFDVAKGGGYGYGDYGYDAEGKPRKKLIGKVPALDIGNEHEDDSHVAKSEDGIVTLRWSDGADGRATEEF